MRSTDLQQASQVFSVFSDSKDHALNHHRDTEVHILIKVGKDLAMRNKMPRAFRGLKSVRSKSNYRSPPTPCCFDGPTRRQFSPGGFSKFSNPGTYILPPLPRLQSLWSSAIHTSVILKEMSMEDNKHMYGKHPSYVAMSEYYSRSSEEPGASPGERVEQGETSRGNRSKLWVHRTLSSHRAQAQSVGQWRDW